MFKIMFLIYAIIFLHQLISAIIAGDAIASIIVCIIVPVVMFGLVAAGYGQDQL